MKKRLFPLFLALLLLLSACGAGVGNSASAAAGDSGSMPDAGCRERLDRGCVGRYR